MSGLPGTGKSAVASAVASKLGAVHLSVDIAEEALPGAGLRRQ
ncbi:MAG: AAA family ATPase [Sciscionella sp.]